MNASLNLKIIGRLKIADAVTGEQLLDQRNAIHPQNIAFAIARALSKDSNGAVYKLCLGNGGTFLNSSLVLTFRPANVSGAQANLYSQTYEVIVDDQAPGVSASNYVVPIEAVDPSISSTVLISALLSSTEPTSNPLDSFTFDEVGLKTEDDLLLTHIIFNPIIKTTAKTFLLTYTLEVSAA